MDEARPRPAELTVVVLRDGGHDPVSRSGVQPVARRCHTISCTASASFTKAIQKQCCSKPRTTYLPFSFFQRSGVAELMTITSQRIAECSARGSRTSVKEQEDLCHVYVQSDSLAGVVTADSEYPSRVAFTLLEKALDEFSKQVDRIDRTVGSLYSPVHSLAWSPESSEPQRS